LKTEKIAYGWQECERAGYKGSRPTVKGKLEPTDRTANIVGAGVRREYKDDSGQLWVKVRGAWWQFPQQVEY